MRHDLVVADPSGLARFFRICGKSQPVSGGIPAVDNRDLGTAGQPGVHIAECLQSRISCTDPLVRKEIV